MKIANAKNESFTRRLKQARLAKGLSQKQLGILAGIDEFVASTRINRYEKGVHQPNIEIVQQIANVLDIPVGYFYSEDDGLAELLISWNKISIEKKEQILDIIRE
ncbi:helix-turn-helix domain-containing protein [Atlantibacter subterraneus]|uniref:helix-turn-helix domain-containing protein n=1 Tax=Atlantibacter subterraneus TaxID=255519 RepID=UPI00289724D9|nr:helix-turn-helix transcriptional regulator [Atlantibacter subterranea]